MMTIPDYVRMYAREKNISLASIEREMGWSLDTIRKMKNTELYKSRIRDLSMVYTDLYDVVPDLRVLAGTNRANEIRDKAIESLELVIKTQSELIESLKKQIRLLEKR